MGAIVLQANLTKQQLDETMSLHPTVAEELIGFAKDELRQASTSSKRI